MSILKRYELLTESKKKVVNMSTPSSGSGLRTFTARIAVIFGLVLLIGGVYLAVLGGSWYYIIAGLLFIATAVLLQKLKSTALIVYALLVLGTVVVCGLWEVGSDFFALAATFRYPWFIWLMVTHSSGHTWF